MKFQPRLDAFRGICIGMVFLGHQGSLQCGWVGVQAFFVLSGYLITGVLLESRNKHPDARTYFKNFYWRRALRILPVYFAFITATPLLAALAGDPWRRIVIANFFDNAPYLFSFSENFYRLASHFNTALYSHLWSLSIEEQFYLIWPLVLFLTPFSRLVWLCSGLVAAGPAIRLIEFAWQLHLDPAAKHKAGEFIYLFTASHIDAFALGALLNFRRDSRLVAGAIRFGTKWMPMAVVGLDSLSHELLCI